MNTLNNQRINPGNRVDFSRIRRFAKGVVPKYQNTPGKLPYNWDWDGLNNAINSGGFGTATATSLGYNKTFTPQGDIKTVADLEQSQNYIDFTNYVKQNATTDPKVMEYLKNLDAKSRKAGATTSHLFDASGNLVQGWENVYDGLRNDGMYGAYHYSANKLTPSEDTVDVTEHDSDSKRSNIPTENTEFNNNQTFTPVDFLPQYQKGKWTGWEHLPLMLGNNLSANWRNYRTAMKQKVPMPEAPQEQGIVTNDYVGRSIMQQQLNEARARNASLASSTSNIDDSTRIQQQFESEVAVPVEMQMAQRQSDEFNRTSQNLQNISNRNQAQRTLYANEKNANLTALHNSLLNEKQKLTSSNASELNSFIQNLATSRRQHELQEAHNKDMYRSAVNDFIVKQGSTKAYTDYQNALKDGWKKDTGYEELYNHLIAGNDANLTDADLQVLTNNKYDLTKVRPILERLAPENPEIQQWLSSLDSYIDNQENIYYGRSNELATRQAKANLFQRAYHSSPNNQYLNMTLAKLYPDMGYFKKGGKVEDRFIKYLEHNRKIIKDMTQQTQKAQDQAQRNLIKELESIDRETLLLLKTIFS